MIITIDGPAGAGKSSVARGLAERLGYEFLDTGALYRMVTLSAMWERVDPADEQRLEAMLADIRLDLRDSHAILNGQDVSKEIRTPEVTGRIAGFADSHLVRSFVTSRTRELALGRNVVTEGRDQGSVVFPNADVKFYLTATDEVRAKRRFSELTAKGLSVQLNDVLADQRRRDREDSNRPSGPLVRPPDAILVDCSDMNLTEVLEILERAVRSATSET